MSEINPILDDYIRAINPMSPEKDRVLGLISQFEARTDLASMGDVLEGILNEADATGLGLFKWLIEFGRLAIEDQAQNISQPNRLLFIYREAKKNINESKAALMLQNAAERWHDDVLSIFGEPNQFSQFKLVDSGKILDWFEFQSNKPKEGTYLRLANRVEVVSAYFSRLELGRLISFFNAIGLDAESARKTMSVADVLVTKKGCQSQDVLDKKFYEALDEKNFWWFHRIPINSMLEY